MMTNAKGCSFLVLFGWCLLLPLIDSLLVRNCLEHGPLTTNRIHSWRERRGVSCHRHDTFLRFSSSSSELKEVTTAKIPPPPGVVELEQWFHKDPSASCSTHVQHASFGTLRGLAWTGPRIKEATNVVTLPASMTLQTAFPHPQWQVRLAEQLWRAVESGEKSNYYGYCALLTAQGTAITPQRFGRNDVNHAVPPFTAPNALRHWTEDQKKWLTESQKGLQLLNVAEQQELKWKSLHDQSAVSVGWSFPQFAWAMEAVCSRAFCGSFGKASNVGSLAVTLAPTVLAALSGVAYWNSSSEPSSFVLGLLLALATLAQFFITTQQEDDSGRAVLLPWIDSANHLEEADSRIEYDPLRQVFTLTIGPNCLLPTQVESITNPLQQVMISYGPKTDAELLLNYGFLPGMPTLWNIQPDDEEDSIVNSQRRWLADEFHRRNSGDK